MLRRFAKIAGKARRRQPSRFAMWSFVVEPLAVIVLVAPFQMFHNAHETGILPSFTLPNTADVDTKPYSI